MQYLEHEAQPGERWDTIAKLYYGDATHIGELVRANVALGEVPPLVFERKTLIKVPVIEQAAADASTLPPWKQAV